MFTQKSAVLFDIQICIPGTQTVHSADGPNIYPRRLSGSFNFKVEWLRFLRRTHQMSPRQNGRQIADLFIIVCSNRERSSQVVSTKARSAATEAHRKMYVAALVS